MAAAAHPTPSSHPRRHLHRPTLAVGLAIAAVLALGASSAVGASPAVGAAPGPAGGVGPIPTTPRPCVITSHGCHVHTSFPFLHTGEVIIASSMFPAGSSGTVRFTLQCPDGYAKGKTVTINANSASAFLSSYGEHPVTQTCTMTQGVTPAYNTVAFLGPANSDDLWPARRPTFFNVARY